MITSIRTDAKRRKLASAAVLAFAVGGLVLSWVSAHAATLDPVTISTPTIQLRGYDSLTNAPLEQTVETAHVRFNPVTLTTNSGVALLQDGVWSAAGRVCSALDSDGDYASCVARAVRSAEPAVSAAVARARSNDKG